MKPLAVHTNDTDNSVAVYCRCPVCSNVNVVENVSVEGITAWKTGAPIQEALAHLSPDEREMLMTGICPTCWDKMFAEGEQ